MIDVLPGGRDAGAALAFPNADPEEVARGLIAEMEPHLVRQLHGSTSRAFVHDDIYEAALPTSSASARS